MAKNTIIIGGGIIGLSTAYYLLKEGHKVTVLDKSNLSKGASYVNAGYLSPSHIIPLASPGVVAQGIKWIFNSSSPFYIKPRFNKDFIQWGWYFSKAANKRNVEKCIPVLKDINTLSKELYTSMHESGELGDFQLQKKGLLMIYKTIKAANHEKEVALRAQDLGLDVRELSFNKLQKLQPGLTKDILGAVHYECDAHTSPEEIMYNLKDYLDRQGVIFRKNEEVLDFETTATKITAVKTTQNSYTADEYIIAIGSWSQNVAKKLGLRIPIQAGKGYRINVQRITPAQLPAILMEAKVAVTPMKGFTRFAGTMELSGINHTIQPKRVEAIAKAASAYYENFKITTQEKKEAQCGLRPISPDGLPFIGRTNKYTNLTIATGHSMLGWSLGPATGKLVSEIISGSKTAMDISSFNPERQF